MNATEVEIFRWSIGQGALAVVLLVVFWKYRSDLKQLIDQRGEELSVLTTIVGESKAALQAQADALNGLRNELHILSEEVRRLGEVTEQRSRRREQ